MTTSPHGRHTRRLAIAGLLGAAALTVGAGAAYAAGTDSRAVETGYAVVVDGRSGPVDAASDCPEQTATGVDVSVEAGDAR